MKYTYELMCLNNNITDMLKCHSETLEQIMLKHFVDNGFLCSERFTYYVISLEVDISPPAQTNLVAGWRCFERV